MDVKLDTEIQESPKQIELAQSLAGLKSWELEYTEIVAYQPAAFNDENYTLFKTEIGKILHGVSQMKDNVVNLVASYQDLANEYIQKDLPDTTVNTDQDTLKTLKQQIKKCEEILDTSAKREEVAKGDVRQLKQDIVNLSTTIKQGVGLSATQERTINDLIAAKEQSTKDLETELEKIVTLRTGLVSISENIEGAEVGKRVLEKEISSLKEKNTAKKIEIDNEMRNKTKLEQELREERVVVTIKSQEVVGKQDSVNRATHDITTLENQIRQQKQMIEKLLRDQESLGTRTVKLQQDYDEQMTETTKLLHENEASMAILKQKEAELYHHLSDVKKMSKLKEILVKKNRFLEDQKVQADQSRKGLRADNDRLLAEIDRRKRQVEVTKKVIDDLVREREILKANLSKTQGECTRLTSHLLLQKQQKTNIELEISRVAREAEDHRKETIKCIKDRDASIAEITLVQTQSNSLITEIKDKEMAIYELKKQMISAENKLKHQQNLYEGVQSDRNLHAKQLLESQGEIAEMKRKLRIMNFQINGYKDDINSKEAALSKTTIENHKLTKDTILIEDEIKTLKHQSMLAQTYIRSQLAEEAKLDLFVKDAELEKSRQENALLILINERDHLSTQLTRRNDELTSIYDKLKTQQSSLLRGEVYYKEKLKQIRQLRASVVEKRLYTSALLDETSGISDLKKTIMMLQNQITQEEMRIKALEEELENPINVHRWRKLEGSDPQTYDMLQMLHTLQKKLICKTKEEREKQQAIEIKEKLYLHLKSLLAKQIGPEALEQANEFEKTLKDKKMQLRHMDTELHMYQAQVQEYKYSIKNMDVEIADVKKRFLAMYTKKAREAEALKKEIANERKQVSTKHDMLPPLPGRDMAFSPTHSQVLASDVPAVNNQEYQALLESTIEEIHDNNDHFPEFQVEVTEELDHSDFKDDQLQELQAKEEIDQSVESGQVVEQADDQAISSEIN